VSRARLLIDSPPLQVLKPLAIRLGLNDGSSISVVPYGIAAEDWTVAGEARDQVRRSMEIGPDEVVIGISSRLIPGKGHDALIEAFARLAPVTSPLRLVIAGDGPLRSEIEARLQSLGDSRILLAGFVTEMPGFVAACDIVVQPTGPELREGFGLAALEAMAAAKPVVVTAVGSLPEVVADGETGLVVAAGDPAALASALERLIDDPALRERLGSAGRERARKHFSVERMAEGTLAVYEKAVIAART